MLMLIKLKEVQLLKKITILLSPLSGSEDYSNLGPTDTSIMYIPFSPQEKKSNDGTPFTLVI